MILCFHRKRDAETNATAFVLVTEDKSVIHRADGVRSRTKLPEGPEWSYEVKLDGYRAIGVKTGREAIIYSRNGKNFNKRYPRLAECLTTLPAETVVDGEVVALDDCGRPEPNHCSHPEIIGSLQQAQEFWDNKRVCNRYRLTHSKQYLAERFGAPEGEIEERPRYNIAPTQPVLTVRKENGKKSRHFTTMRWGLIPSWAKDMGIGTRTLNARSETVTTTPAFRDSILTKRCLIPADGFYEWRKWDR